jgi:LmbE family N-acetylglucosaminyl deacetylase
MFSTANVSMRLSESRTASISTHASPSGRLSLNVNSDTLVPVSARNHRDSERDGCPALHRLCQPFVTSRVLLVVSHPDDETIGAGALLARSTDAHVVLVTDGAPADPTLWPLHVREGGRPRYATVRRREFLAALGVAGLPPTRVHELGVADGGAIDAVPAIVDALVTLIEKIDPDSVLTHAYEGGHVDHDATSLAVWAAMMLTKRGHPHEMALYNQQHGNIVTHEFLHHAGPGRTVWLDERLRAKKTAMLEHYASQKSQYSLYFDVDVERFRCGLPPDFSRPPGAEVPLYERIGAFTTGEEWRSRARQALQALGLEDSQGRSAGTFAVTRATSGSGEREDANAALPLVSVIVRTIGRETLADALDSIERQTYRNLEIIVVDAVGSCVSDRMAERDNPSIRLCGGRALNRPQAANAGLDAAVGEYALLLDDDDWLHPEHVARLAEALKGSNGARVAYGDVEVVGWSRHGFATRIGTFADSFDSIGLLCENRIPVHAALFARSLVSDGCRFDEALDAFEDWDFWIQLSRHSSFCHVRGIGAAYRWPPGSGVDQRAGTEKARAYIFRKWQHAVSPDGCVAILHRAWDAHDMNRALQTRVEEQDKALTAVKTELVARENDLSSVRAKLETQLREIDRLNASAEAEANEIRRLNDEVHASRRDAEHLRAGLTIAEHRLAATFASRSWRWMAPLRAAFDIVLSVSRRRQSASAGEHSAE